MTDPYQTLGVARDATADEITKAYRRLAREHHPDRNPGDDQAAARFREVREAFELLTDPERRRRFDETGDASDRRRADGPAGVMTVLGPCLLGVLRTLQSTGRGAEREDVVGHMRKALAEAERMVRQPRPQLLKEKALYEAAAGRLEVDEGEDNLLAAAARSQLARVEAELARVDAEAARIRRAVEYLARCRYRFDKPPVEYLTPDAAASATRYRMLFTRGDCG